MHQFGNCRCNITAPKAKTTADTNHPCRARFELRDVIDQMLIAREDRLRMFIATLTTLRERYTTRRAA